MDVVFKVTFMWPNLGNDECPSWNHGMRSKGTFLIFRGMRNFAATVAKSVSFNDLYASLATTSGL